MLTQRRIFVNLSPIGNGLDKANAARFYPKLKFKVERKMMVMAYQGQVFSPGDIVPESGIYQCTRCGDNSSFSTDVRGHRFPPSHCTGAKWKLVEMTPHR